MMGSTEFNGWPAKLRILSAVVHPRLLGLAPVAGFAVLAAVLTAMQEIPLAEALWAVVAVAAAFAPSGWASPAGWPRRLAEGALLPVAYALVMIADPTMRRMALPPLLLLAGWGAAAAALARAPGHQGPLLAASLGVSVRAAAGLGLMGYPWLVVVGTLLACGGVPAALARRWGPQTGVAAALLVPWLPFAQHPWLLAAAVLAILAARLAPKRGEPLEPLAARWVPQIAAAALVAAALAPWGGMPLERLFPAAGWLAGIGAVLALVLAGRYPAAVGGAAWLAATCLIGPVQPAPPHREGVTLTAAAPIAPLPVGSGGTYVVDVALSNATFVAAGTPVVEVELGEQRWVLKAGEDTAEWAHQRPDVRAAVAHPLPPWPVWRPVGEGREAVWGVAGRLRAPIPGGNAPIFKRLPNLPAEVIVAIATAGPSRPTPPRSLTLPTWLAGTALAVALLQLFGRSWRRPAAALPWVLLAAGAATVRAAVEPLRLLAELHGVDLCLAALLAAWLPVGWEWLRRRRVFAAAAAVLVPLAMAAAYLHPPGGDEQYHLIVLRSLVQDQDLNLANNYELERYPENRIYVTPTWLHSPALALLLSPGYAVAGRPGALTLLALAGAALLAVTARLAHSLALSPARTRWVWFMATFSFPLATFSSQIWTEIPGALAAATVAVLLVGGTGTLLLPAGVAILATVLKTRLGVVTFAPLAGTLTLLVRQPRRLLGVAALLWVTVSAAFAITTTIYGHPLGPMRRFHHLLPQDFRQPAISLLGLVFDRAGGVLFSAPFLLVALAGLGRVWRRGGAPLRGLLLGGLATLLLLLPSHEWYGGGSPPLRYLVPTLPVFFLGLAAVGATPTPVRRALFLAFPPSAFVWFIFATRPHLAFNPGDGGWWLGDALARRFAVDTWALFPSFLVPSPANLWVPAVVILAIALGGVLLHRRPGFGRVLGRVTVSLWLVVSAGLVATLLRRTDGVVEFEAAQVLRHGGVPEPAAGTFSRFLYRNGWRLGSGEAVTVPLNLPANARVEIELMGDGVATARWEGGREVTAAVSLPSFTSLPLPPPPGEGRQRLHVSVASEVAGEFVLDRVRVLRP